jgi:hypothetical protein
VPVPLSEDKDVATLSTIAERTALSGLVTPLTDQLLPRPPTQSEFLELLQSQDRRPGCR